MKKLMIGGEEETCSVAADSGSGIQTVLLCNLSGKG